MNKHTMLNIQLKSFKNTRRVGKYILCYAMLFIIVIICVYYIHSYIKVYNDEQQEIQEIDNMLFDWHNHVKNSETASQFDNYKLVHNLNEDKSDECVKENTDNADRKSDDQEEDMADCVLIIPSIDLKKYVYSGKQRETHLEQYELVTATDDMKYMNGGNYIICGHYSKLYGHSLNRLKDISELDEVIIWHNDKQTKYKVSSVSYMNMNNTSQYCNQSNNRQITILSCAKYEGKNKYIVVRCECAN